MDYCWVTQTKNASHPMTMGTLVVPVVMIGRYPSVSIVRSGTQSAIARSGTQRTITPNVRVCVHASGVPQTTFTRIALISKLETKSAQNVPTVKGHIQHGQKAALFMLRHHRAQPDQRRQRSSPPHPPARPTLTLPWATCGKYWHLSWPRLLPGQSLI